MSGWLQFPTSTPTATGRSLVCPTEKLALKKFQRTKAMRRFIKTAIHPSEGKSTNKCLGLFGME